VPPSLTSPVLAPSSIALPARHDAARGPLPCGSEHLDAAPIQHAGDSPPTTAPCSAPALPDDVRNIIYLFIYLLFIYLFILYN